MDEKQHGDPEGNELRLLRRGAKQNAVNKDSAAQVQQEIEKVIAGRRVTIDEAVDEEGQIQNRPDHMIEMADERAPPVEMRILKNGRDVVELKDTLEAAGIGCQGNRGQQ